MRVVVHFTDFQVQIRAIEQNITIICCCGSFTMKYYADDGKTMNAYELLKSWQNDSGWAAHHREKLAFPKTVWLTLTRACNLHCTWCYSTQALQNVPAQMDEITLLKLIEPLAQQGVKRFVLIGGEPTLFPGIERIINQILETDCRVGVATNGIRLADPTFTKNICHKQVFFNISLKGVCEQEYISLTGRPGLSDAISGIETLNKLKANYVLSFVLTKNSVEQLNDLHDLLLSAHVSEIVFQTDKPSFSNPLTPDYIRVLAESCKLADRIFSATRDCLKYKFELSFPLCMIEKAFATRLIKEDLIDICCDIGRCNGIVLDCDGSLLPCNHFIGYPLLDGPADAKRIISYCKSSTYKTFGNFANRFPMKKCKNCIWWDVCRGGCLIEWIGGK